MNQSMQSNDLSYILPKSISKESKIFPFIQSIADAEMSMIQSSMTKSGELSEGQITLILKEYKRWLVLIKMGHRGLPMISRLVDFAWHTHILFTRDYHKFCNDIFGNYVHHLPLPVPNQDAVDFHQIYSNVYGEVPTIWEWTGDCCVDDGDFDDGEDFCYHNEPSDDD